MTALLVFGPDEHVQVNVLRALAEKSPVDVFTLAERMKSAEESLKHRAQMQAQTITIPRGFTVTFSVEVGHPVGVCRHMSMAAPDAGRLPAMPALWLVAEALGFVDGLWACTVWKEEISAGGFAVNIVQPYALARPGGHA